MKKTLINIAHLNGNFLKHKYNMNYIPSFVSNLKHSQQGFNPSSPFHLNIKNKFILNTNKKIAFKNNDNNNNKQQHINFIQRNYETKYNNNNNTTNSTLNNKNYEELLKEKNQQIAQMQKRLLVMKHTIAKLRQDNIKTPLNSSIVLLKNNNNINRNNSTDNSIIQSKRQTYKGRTSSNIIVHSVEELKHGSYNSLPSTPHKSSQMKLKKTFSLSHYHHHNTNTSHIKEQCIDLKIRANDLLNNYYKHILYIDNRKCYMKNQLN